MAIAEPVCQDWCNCVLLIIETHAVNDWHIIAIFTDFAQWDHVPRASELRIISESQATIFGQLAKMESSYVGIYIWRLPCKLISSLLPVREK